MIIIGIINVWDLWFCSHLIKTRGESKLYASILVPFSAKRIATQVLIIAKLNGKKDFILRVFVCDIIRPSKELPVQS